MVLINTIVMSVLMLALCYHEYTCSPSYNGSAGSGGSASSEGSSSTDHSTDISECELHPRPCHTNAECINTDGGYLCECLLGFRGNGTYCTEVVGFATCESGPQSCDKNAQCTNTEDGVYCDCNEGFQGNGVQCTDIDECTTKSDICHRSASCVNKMGGYDCECIFGYKGNGTHCTQHTVQIIAFVVGTGGGLVLLSAIVLVDIYICRRFLRRHREKVKHHRFLHHREQLQTAVPYIPNHSRQRSAQTEQEDSTVIHNPSAPGIHDMTQQPYTVQTVEMELRRQQTNDPNNWNQALRINEWPT